MEAPGRAEHLFRDEWRTGDFQHYVAQGIPLYCGNLYFAQSPRDEIVRDVHPILPPGVEDFSRLVPFFFETDSHYWLYVSIEGALTSLHYDNNAVHACLAQVKGKKKATLFAPEDEQHVRNSEFGWMDPENPESDKFPSVHRATAWEVELVAGQALILGGRWSHHVRTLEPSVTVGYDFINRSNLELFVREHWRLKCIGIDYMTSLFPTTEDRRSPLERLMRGVFSGEPTRATQFCGKLLAESSRVHGGPLGAGSMVAEATLEELLTDTRPGADHAFLAELLRTVQRDRRANG
mgnify:CR=1 FL=1